MLNIHSCDCNAAKWAERKGRGMLLGEEVWILIGTDAAETNKVWRNGGRRMASGGGGGGEAIDWQRGIVFCPRCPWTPTDQRKSLFDARRGLKWRIRAKRFAPHSGKRNRPKCH